MDEGRIIPKREQLRSLMNEIKQAEKKAVKDLGVYLETENAQFFVNAIDHVRGQCLPGSAMDLILMEVQARLQVLRTEVAEANREPKEEGKTNAE